MDYEKIAEEGCQRAGLSRRRAKEVASEVALAFIKAEQKTKKKKKDVTEIENTYKIKDVKEG